MVPKTALEAIVNDANEDAHLIKSYFLSRGTSFNFVVAATSS